MNRVSTLNIQRHNTTLCAFSLVELSIVLVILGLLTGGVLAGKSLIRAAELRSVHADIARHLSAYNSFRDKYMALPGDIANATSFWTSAGGTGGDSTCFMAQTASSTATCNGSGDGMVSGVTGHTYAERFSVWKHMANAGLIEGNYTGRTSGAAGTFSGTAGTEWPASKISQAFFDITYIVPNAGTYFTGTSLNVNTLGFRLNPLTPEETWNIDTKLDDGSPVYGKIFNVIRSFTTDTACVTSDADTATYDIAAAQTKTCLFFIKLN